ncbi:prepilin peptidase [Nocardia aurantiaca]|uniref:Prepilin peptidase n=1 Tax=Nocardia aurantiaca TaxID=2675850 RepID=A0A6I3KY41_9NOCA|nr:A24 family peptidase [Nocardia aurantiaca]MTE15012.1 prepilin peptidase [Nocardia aurantiaca]
MTPLPLLLFTVWCAALTAHDVYGRRLPNALTLPGAAAALGYGFAVGEPAFAITGAVLLAVPYLLVHLCRPHALGAGDVKLAFGLGAATALAGPHAWSWAALAAPMLTASAGIGMLAVNLVGRREVELPRRADAIGTLPHGPAMCAASVVALVAGR